MGDLFYLFGIIYILTELNYLLTYKKRRKTVREEMDSALQAGLDMGMGNDSGAKKQISRFKEKAPRIVIGLFCTIWSAIGILWTDESRWFMAEIISSVTISLIDIVVTLFRKNKTDMIILDVIGYGSPAISILIVGYILYLHFSPIISF